MRILHPFQNFIHGPRVGSNLTPLEYRLDLAKFYVGEILWYTAKFFQEPSYFHYGHYIVAVPLLLSIFVLFPFYISRTRHIPGPYIARVTVLYFAYRGYYDTANEYVHSLHEKYGPVVLVSPGCISLNTAADIRTVYGVRSKFNKPLEAQNLNNYGKPNAFSTPANDDHRRRRGRYASSYSKTNVTTGHIYKAMETRARLLLEQVRSTADPTLAVDVYQLLHYYAVDVTAIVATGISTGLMDGKNRAFSRALRGVFTGLSYVFWFNILDNITSWLPFTKVSLRLLTPRVRDSYFAYGNLKAMVYAFFQKASKIDNAKRENPDSVLEKLKTHKDYGTEDLTDMHIASEIMDHMLAGADTLVAGLAYTLYELADASNKSYLYDLVSDLDRVEFTEDGLPVSFAAIDKLESLENVLREGLRLHTPSGHIQTRVVPKGGEMVAGYYMPEGTHIGVSLYSIHLNEKNFPPTEGRYAIDDSDMFKPDRWSEKTPYSQTIRTMNTSYMVFGYGSRICVGKDLALVQMKLLLAVLLHSMTIQQEPLQQHKELLPIQGAVLRPAGNRILLKFSKRPNIIAAEIAAHKLPRHVCREGCCEMYCEPTPYTLSGKFPALKRNGAWGVEKDGGDGGGEEEENRGMEETKWWVDNDTLVEQMVQERSLRPKKGSWAEWRRKVRFGVYRVWVLRKLFADTEVLEYYRQKEERAEYYRKIKGEVDREVAEERKMLNEKVKEQETARGEEADVLVARARKHEFEQWKVSARKAVREEAWLKMESKGLGVKIDDALGKADIEPEIRSQEEILKFFKELLPRAPKEE